jgi:hypothetical protein
LLAVLAACGDDAAPRGPAPLTAPAAARAVADPAEGITTELDGVAPGFYDGVLAELTGDETAARGSYERVLASPDSPTALAARSALHLAQLEARAGKSRHALDLVARATRLAPGDHEIENGVAQVEADVVAAAGAGDLRGPALGTALPGVDGKLAEDFADADRALARVHAIRPRQRVDVVWAKEDATEVVVARFRAVASHGGLAEVAASYRIGSVFHDLALDLLLFEVPPRFGPDLVAELRRTLRAHALAYAKRAAASYEACLSGALSPDAELWRLAAETDLRSARDVLGAAGEAQTP